MLLRKYQERTDDTSAKRCDYIMRMLPERESFQKQSDSRRFKNIVAQQVEGDTPKMQ
jgi:hypothetical protein